jgi:hypothetical protein
MARTIVAIATLPDTRSERHEHDGEHVVGDNHENLGANTKG